MGIFSKLFGGNGGLGNVESICPYCDNHLKERPKRKKRCPHCGNHIYVRTRPTDRKKVLATEEMAQQIDEEWMKIHGTYEDHNEEQQRFVIRKRELSRKFGTEASDFDVKWSILNEDLMTHAADMNWGLYRNTRFQMAEQLRKEGRERQALVTYLEVSFLDANGPSNREGISDPELLRRYPMFDPETGFQAPAIVATIQKLASKQSLSRSELKGLFLKTAQRHHENLKLPIDPDDGWLSLQSELEK